MLVTGAADIPIAFAAVHHFLPKRQGLPAPVTLANRLACPLLKLVTLGALCDSVRWTADAAQIPVALRAIPHQRILCHMPLTAIANARSRLSQGQFMA